MDLENISHAPKKQKPAIRHLLHIYWLFLTHFPSLQVSHNQQVVFHLHHFFRQSNNWIVASWGKQLPESLNEAENKLATFFTRKQNRWIISSLSDSWVCLLKWLLTRKCREILVHFNRNHNRHINMKRVNWCPGTISFHPIFLKHTALHFCYWTALLFP